MLTVWLYIIIPKGFFPMQDTGRDPGHVRGGAIDLIRRHGGAPAGAGGRRSSQDPAVASLSSFIGVDGTNTTLNSGRISDQSQAASTIARRSAIDIIRRLQPSSPRCPGITLYLQPVQDLTIERPVSRTQYQFSVETANPDA